MKPVNIILGLLFTLIFSVVVGSALPIPVHAQWAACCERQKRPCSKAANLTECYIACQKGCGDPDSTVGKKCRQYCNINFAQVSPI